MLRQSAPPVWADRQSKLSPAGAWDWGTASAPEPCPGPHSRCNLCEVMILKVLVPSVGGLVNGVTMLYVVCSTTSNGRKVYLPNECRKKLTQTLVSRGVLRMLLVKASQGEDYNVWLLEIAQPPSAELTAEFLAQSFHTLRFDVTPVSPLTQLCEPRLWHCLRNCQACFCFRLI